MGAISLHFESSDRQIGMGRLTIAHRLFFKRLIVNGFGHKTAHVSQRFFGMVTPRPTNIVLAAIHRIATHCAVAI